MTANIILKNHLEERGISVIAFANMVGVGRQIVYDWLKGKKIPSDESKQKIYSVTNGKLEPNHWCNIKTATTSKVTERKVKRK